jgi:predicted unusual protein kinase regulating ubiquinone biosynthesis (AarF/ABC1/UbiB family)
MATPERSERSSSKRDSADSPGDGDAIPTGKVRRATSTTAALGPSGARLAASLIANLGRSPERAREVLEARHTEVAEQAVELLGNLRGGAMKIGQLASFVDVEFLPPEYRAIYQEKLAKLRDAAPAMSWEKVRRVLEGEWEQPVSEVLAEVSHQALAAASIGQVHRGVLHDGREVAIKVQYPEIADALESDLELASVLIGLGRAIAPGLDPKIVAGELRERVLEELDFELEAQQQRTFARAYRDHPFIFVPPVLSTLSRRRVLVSEWVSGRRFDDVLALSQEERDRVGEIIVRFFFGSMERIGRFNTDPHPGNYLLLDDGRMAFLDFGNTVSMSRNTIELQRRAVMAGVEGDAAEFVRLASELGYVRDLDRIDRDALLTQWVMLADWYVSDRELRIDPDYVATVLAALVDPRAFDGALRLVRQIKVPPEEIWVRRVETSVLAVLGQLRAQRNWHRIMMETLGGEPATELGGLERAYWEGRGFATRSSAERAP